MVNLLNSNRLMLDANMTGYATLELKGVPFIPDFAGKLNFYVSGVDELMKQSDDNPKI